MTAFKSYKEWLAPYEAKGVMTLQRVGDSSQVKLEIQKPQRS